MLGYASVDRMLAEMSAEELVSWQLRAEMEGAVADLVQQGMDRDVAHKFVYTPQGAR